MEGTKYESFDLLHNGQCQSLKHRSRQQEGMTMPGIMVVVVVVAAAMVSQ